LWGLFFVLSCFDYLLFVVDFNGYFDTKFRFLDFKNGHEHVNITFSGGSLDV
jgi:hypothetical protein